MPDRGPRRNEGRILRRLDGVLPGEIDRRAFLQGAAGTVGAAMLAGCLDDSVNDREETRKEEVTFTTPWVEEPSWGMAHVADQGGYWKDGSVGGITATRGDGSDTEARNVGTGSKEMGIGDMTTSISVYPGDEDTDALDMNLVAMAKGRPLLSLIWRTDEVADRADVAGKRVLLASGFASATWDMYPELAGVDPDEVETEEAGAELGPAWLAENEVQAIWGSIDLLPVYEEEADVELGVEPLTGFGPFYGYPIWVNGSWYEDREDSVEYVADVITGYFKAMKWALLNQGDYLSYLQEEVNTDLQTWEDHELEGQHQSLCAQAVTLDMKEEGLGYFTEDGVQNHLDVAGDALLDDASALPSASDLVIKEPWEESEKVTFSDDEWNQLADTAGELWGPFEEAAF